MNDPLPTTTTNEPLAYQPVSGWAVAGCIAAGLFALLVVMSAIVGVFQGAPVFFYQWIVVLPIAAVVLCLIGRHQVDNSEGTRTGANLARVGLWLAVVSSVTYFSYYYVTRWAVENQADAFLREKTDDAGFFPRLVEGGKDNTQLNLAFLLTKPRNDRTGNPDPTPTCVRSTTAAASMARRPCGCSSAKARLDAYSTRTWPRTP